MSRCRKITGLFLVVVYAFFFASTNFFYHSHQLADCKLVHSHPFHGAGHSHTASQIVLIGAIDSSTYQESSSVTVPDFIPESFGCGTSICLDFPVITLSIFSFSLRAPPASC